MRIFVLLLSMIMLLSVATTSLAQIYRWVDKDGKVHYTNTPPPSEEVTKVTRGSDSSSSDDDTDSEESSEEANDEDGESEEASESKSSQQAERREMCSRAVRELGSAIDGYLDGARKNLKSGHITQAQYDEVRNGFANMRSKASVSHCRSAKGSDLELYECLADNYGDVVFSCKQFIQ